MKEDVIYVARRKADGETAIDTSYAASRKIKAYTTRGRAESAMKATFRSKYDEYEIVEYVPKGR